MRQDVPPHGSILDLPAFLRKATEFFNGQIPLEVKGTLWGVIPFQFTIKPGKK